MGIESTVALLELPGVYGPRPDSLLLAGLIPAHVREGDRVLDVFTGCGVLAVTAAAAGAGAVSAVDVSRRAMLSVAINSRLNGVTVRAQRGSMFDPVLGQRFDLIVANPPYVPSATDDVTARGAARAWEAGPDGRRFLDPFLERLPDHLGPTGRVLLVQSSICDTERTVTALSSAGIDADIVACQEAPLGPITAPRAQALEQRGLLRRGQRTEETVVICGTVHKPLQADRGPAPPVMSSG